METGDENRSMHVSCRKTDVELFLNGSVHEFYRLKALITRKRLNTLMVGKKKNVTVARKDKTLPRFQKHFPESKNTSQNPNHFPESRFWDAFWIVRSVLDSGKCFVLMSHRRMLMSKANWSGVISMRFISTMIDAMTRHVHHVFAPWK